MKWIIIIVVLILMTTATLARMDLTIQLGIEEVSGGGPSADALLLESGDYLLLETGDYLLLE